jgi:hypothetical protein
LKKGVHTVNYASKPGSHSIVKVTAKCALPVEVEPEPEPEPEPVARASEPEPEVLLGAAAAADRVDAPAPAAPRGFDVQTVEDHPDVVFI